MSAEVQGIRKLGLQIIVPSSSAFKIWRAKATEVWNNESIDKDLVRAVALLGGAEGGGDACPADVCRCDNRTCKKECCPR
jgi:hypothetical protein